MRRPLFILVVLVPLLMATSFSVPDGYDTSDFQEDLPQPPQCPFGFEEDEVADCRPVEYDKRFSTDLTVEDREATWEPPSLELPSNWNVKDFGVWVMVTIIATMLVLVVLYVLRRRGKKPKIDDTPPSDFVSTLREKTRDESHQKLADLSEFDAAIHALLLDIITRIFRQKPELNKPSITAREISNAFTETGEIHHDLSRLILRVELSRFARVPATLEDYKDASKLHESLVRRFGGSSE